jgi:hypothetical protein
VLRIQPFQEEIPDGGVDLVEAVADLMAKVREEQVGLGRGRQGIPMGAVEEEVYAEQVDEAGVKRDRKGSVTGQVEQSRGMLMREELDAPGGFGVAGSAHRGRSTG